MPYAPPSGSTSTMVIMAEKIKVATGLQEGLGDRNRTQAPPLAAPVARRPSPGFFVGTTGDSSDDPQSSPQSSPETLTRRAAIPWQKATATTTAAALIRCHSSQSLDLTRRPGNGQDAQLTRLTPLAQLTAPTPMLRKKSGEVVKPSLKSCHSTDSIPHYRPKSAPTTPSLPKNVRFGQELEHVKWFLAGQRPTAVSRAGSPTDETTEDEFPFPRTARAGAGAGAGAGGGPTTLELRLPKFRQEAESHLNVSLESIALTDDLRAIKGSILVRNLAYQKWVAVRFTFDDWHQVSEVSAEYQGPATAAAAVAGAAASHDRFAFTIKLTDLLAKIQEKTLWLAVRYTAAGGEYWDNNAGENYRVQFRRRPCTSDDSESETMTPRAAAGAAASDVASGPIWSHLHGHGLGRGGLEDLQRELSKIASLDNLLPDSPRDTGPPTKLETGPPGHFASRYNFADSLRQVPKRGSAAAAAATTSAERPAATLCPRPGSSTLPSMARRSSHPPARSAPLPAAAETEAETSALFADQLSPALTSGTSTNLSSPSSGQTTPTHGPIERADANEPEPTPLPLPAPREPPPPPDPRYEQLVAAYCFFEPERERERERERTIGARSVVSSDSPKGLGAFEPRMDLHSDMEMSMSLDRRYRPLVG